MQTDRFRNLFIKELPQIPAQKHVSLTELEPVSIKRINDNVTRIDFGQAAFGNIVMPIPAGRGTAKVQFGEKLKGDRIDQEPPGTVRYGMTPIRLGQQQGNWIVSAPVDVRNIEQAGLNEADAYLNQLSHYTTDDNVMMAARTFDWLMENGTWPTEWSPHMVFMAHAQWMHSGDTECLAHRYESLKSKTLMHRSGDDGLVRNAEIDRTRHDIVDWPKKERDGFVFTEINTVVNAFHIAALQQMAEMATAVGKTDDAHAFHDRIELARASFQQQLFDKNASIYRDGTQTDHSSMHATFFPLAFGLVPDASSTQTCGTNTKQRSTFSKLALANASVNVLAVKSLGRNCGTWRFGVCVLREIEGQHKLF